MLWGALHGFYLLYEAATSSWRDRAWARVSRLGLNTKSIRRVVAWLTTFNVVVLAWVFFRANSLHDAMVLLSKMWPTHHPVSETGLTGLGRLVQNVGVYNMATAIFAILALLIVDAVSGDGNIDSGLRNAPL